MILGLKEVPMINSSIFSIVDDLEVCEKKIMEDLHFCSVLQLIFRLGERF